MRWSVWSFAAFLIVVLTGGWACDHKLPPGAPVGGSATNGAIVTVGYGAGDVFQPAAVTILSGTAVTWYLSSGSHTVNVDDGTGTSTCADFDFTSSAPGTQVVETFSTSGLYNFHCDVHSVCGSNPLPNCNVVCDIMTGTVSVR
jgi:plastocyanin